MTAGGTGLSSGVGPGVEVGLRVTVGWGPGAKAARQAAGKAVTVTAWYACMSVLMKYARSLQRT